MFLSRHAEMLEIEGPQGKCCPVLFHGDGDWALVDTGFPLQYDLIMGAMEKAGFVPGRLRAILLTHQDLDHIGNVRELIASNPGVQVLAHKDEAPYLDGRKTPVKLAKMAQDNPFYQNFKAGFENRRFSVDQELSDEEFLPFFGGIQVLHTPGHTPGHACFYLRADKVLVAGDALNVENGALKGPNPIHTLDMELAGQSLQKLAHYEIQAIATYHGGKYDGGLEGLGR